MIMGRVIDDNDQEILSICQSRIVVVYNLSEISPTTMYWETIEGVMERIPKGLRNNH